MTEPVTLKMKEFVESQISNITTEHEKMISGWKNVDMAAENIKHLYGLFKKCSRQELRIFEERNFLGRTDAAERYELITKKLICEKESTILKKNENSKQAAPTKGLVKKKGNKKKGTFLDNKETSTEVNGYSYGEINEKVEDVAPEDQVKSQFSSNVDEDEVFEKEVDENEKPTDLNLKMTPEDMDSKKAETNSCSKFPNENKSEHKPSSSVVQKSEEVETAKDQNPVVKIMSRIEESSGKTETVMPQDITIRPETTSSVKSEEVIFKSPEHPKRTNNENNENKTNEEVSKTENKETPSKTPKTSAAAKKNRNPFDNEHSFIEPLLSSTANTKEVDNIDNLHSVNNYMSRESTVLKSSLQKLATDISTEEQQIRERLEMGESASMDNAVLEDFIMRANTVLKETEAVTVRKIAEAETKKFLASIRMPPENALEHISNELIQDIWPKSNRWRSFARVRNYESPPLDEVNLKEKKRREEQIERDVRAAIKSAGEPLNKKQIGQIRKAAIAYRDFDIKEQQEIDYRSDHIIKLVELVSAYEASSKMDELMLMRLAIAFCTKRRDYFLKFKPPNFMQFSYMYIFLLEKMSSKTASICACLNYQSKSGDFEELEELMLNLFHEDYFLEMK